MWLFTKVYKYINMKHVLIEVSSRHRPPASPHLSSLAVNYHGFIHILTLSVTAAKAF